MAIYHSDHNRRLTCHCGSRYFYELDAYSYIVETTDSYTKEFTHKNLVCSVCDTIVKTICDPRHIPNTTV